MSIRRARRRVAKRESKKRALPQYDNVQDDPRYPLFVADFKTRNVTLTKRRKSLVKKAMELSILTGSSVALQIVNHEGLRYRYHGTARPARDADTVVRDAQRLVSNRDYPHMYGEASGVYNDPEDRPVSDPGDEACLPDTPAGGPDLKSGGTAPSTPCLGHLRLVKPESDSDDDDGDGGGGDDGWQLSPTYSLDNPGPFNRGGEVEFLPLVTVDDT